MALNIEDTAAVDIKDSCERELTFKIIQYVMKNVNRQCTHRLAAHPDLPYSSLMFQSGINSLSLVTHIIPIVSRFGDRVRNIRIEYPDLGISTGLALVVELYAGGSELIRDDLPQYSPTSYRVDQFKDEVEDKIPKDFSSQLSKEWKNTLLSMKNVSEMVNNMENARHTTKLDFLGTKEDGPSGKYILTFGKVKNIEYSFLQEVCSSQGERIGDIRFHSDSEAERTMEFVFLDESNKERRVRDLPERCPLLKSKKRKRQ